MATNAAFMVQNATGGSTLAASTTAVWGSNTTSGDLIIVVVGTTSTTINSVTSITDSQGNLYTQLQTNETAGSLGDVEIWYAKNILGGTTPTITVNFSGAITSAVIAREYYGLDPVNPINQSNGSATGSNSAPTSNTVNTTNFPCLLVGVMGQVGITGTISLGTNWNNLTTQANGNEIAIEDQYVAYTGSYSSTFNLTLSLQWECAIVALNLAPHGTTTSTSSTSASTFSTSSTSSSISSTSSSVSSTSASSSTSSTSLSTSSTSSSISSTSSSTSSTSISSTSSSTSISSTSSSFSSTSFSSTSLSSTSSSTSISSTSSSFSSTSSSISSTSSSVSSTSFSSTSSSSSTSTTTLPPPYQTYRYTDSLIANSPIKFIQSTSGTNATGATATTNTSAFSSPITSGNAILVSLANDGAAGSVKSVTDTLKNTYIRLSTVGSGVTTEIWAAFNVIGGASNVVTANQGFNDGVIFAQEWSGLMPIVSIDRTVAATGNAGSSGNISTLATGTLTEINELLFVAGEIDVVAGTSVAAGSGFTNFSTAASNGVNGAVESRVVSSTNSVSGVLNLTLTSTTGWRLSMVTLKGLNMTTFNAVQYGNVSTDDGDYFIERGSEYMIREYKSTHPNNTDSISFTWKGRSTESTLVSPILVQIYNVNSSTWETLAVANKVPADTDFSTTVSQTTNLSNYYDSTNTVTFRSYQQVI